MQCVINIREHKYTTYRNIQKDFVGFAVLYHGEGIDQRMLTFHPKYQANFKYEEDDVYLAFRDHILTYDENEEIELVKRLGDPTTTLCQCLWYLMENRKWNYPETFNDRTGLHKNYHGKIKNDKYAHIAWQSEEPWRTGCSAPVRFRLGYLLPALPSTSCRRGDA